MTLNALSLCFRYCEFQYMKQNDIKFQFASGLPFNGERKAYSHMHEDSKISEYMNCNSIGLNKTFISKACCVKTADS